MGIEKKNQVGEAGREQTGCTCPRNPDGTLKMFIHFRDDCAVVRESLLERETAAQKNRTSW